ERAVGAGGGKGGGEEDGREVGFGYGLVRTVATDGPGGGYRLQVLGHACGVGGGVHDGERSRALTRSRGGRTWRPSPPWSRRRARPPARSRTPNESRS